MKDVLEIKLVKPWAPGYSKIIWKLKGDTSLTKRSQCRNGENDQRGSTGKGDFILYFHYFGGSVYLNAYECDSSVIRFNKIHFHFAMCFSDTENFQLSLLME
jgi:hypothetical protein